LYPWRETPSLPLCRAVLVRSPRELLSIAMAFAASTAASSLGLLLFVGLAAAAVEPEDKGFETLFRESLDEVYPAHCVDVAGLPGFLDGTYVTQSTAQYGMGGKEFNAWLDSYWKVHAVQLKQGHLCYKSKIIRTGFYNNSLEKGTVAGQVLFLETTPPRECYLGGVCNVFGAANDNNFAASYRVADEKNGGYRYALMTDTNVHLDFDIDTLAVIGSRKFDDHFGKLFHMQQGGGTHLQCEAGKGNSATDCQGDLFGVVFEQGATNLVDLYRLRAGKPDVRELVAHIPVPWAPGSLHSFGITDDFAIIPMSPFTIDGLSLLKGHDIMGSIKSMGDTTPIFLVDLHDGSIRNVTFQGAIHYVHVVNSWQNDTHVVFDASVFERQPFTLDNPAMVLSVLRNKTARDSATNTQTIRRYAIDRSSDSVTEQKLTHGPEMIDFPRVASSKYGRPYCVYYGIEWNHNGREYGSWALRKQNFCTGEVVFHYEPNNYLSEPTFVSNGGGTEDGGVVMTMRTNGVTGQSDHLVLDAKTMRIVSETRLPHQLGFWGHGAYFSNVAPVVIV